VLGSIIVVLTGIPFAGYRLVCLIKRTERAARQGEL
jgi:hypothetical protein